ncbi:acetyl-CoA acetyltransferase [Luteitalea sp. TBR-22]|uniref:thiolase family protein n=1 Tax=Luteitalea sp. TBR-22 TaxID=2802971 RepID=UPI001AF73DFA|nr:acetyl-CoA C-acyltransferase [Luteitalea sp. TBR-22]BCS35739.1 acetyl-CoA acetyltransferase [Luteitalea sp. TBR-22]
MTDAVIVSAVRTPVGKAPRGQFQYVRPDDLAAIAIRAAMDRVPTLDASTIDDVILGCAMPEAEQGMNVARIASLRAGVPHSAAAVTVNRFCASGLEAIATAVDRIRSGAADVVIAGGTESMSLVPMGGHKIAPNPGLVASYPDVYLTTGLVAENHAREHGISRQAQDAYALESHRRAVAAQAAGRFADEIVPVPVARIGAAGATALAPASVIVSADEGPRADTSIEALGKLRPAFHVQGTVTAGNASQMSDGAAAVVAMSETRARELGIAPIARLVAYATAGVEPERFGIGPVPAVRKLLARTGLALADIDLFELNEAFASQVLACAHDLELDLAKVNVNGGAIALGHPLGCTGAKLTATLVHELRRRKGRYGIVTMCVGGGMGAAGLFEAL